MQKKKSHQNRRWTRLEEAAFRIMNARDDELSQMTVQSLADDIGITPTHLCRLYNKRCGEKKRHLARLSIEWEKMRRARRLLECNREIRVEQVGNHFGIAKEEDFCRKFKEHFHVTPGQYRKHYFLQKKRVEEPQQGECV